MTELLHQLLLEGRRDSVFEALSLIVHLVPLHAKNLREHSLDEMMANDSALGNLASLAGEPDGSVAFQGNQAILRQPFQSKSYGGPGDGEPVGKCGGDNVLTFRLGFSNSLEVILFGDSDSGHMLA